jgi:carbonic anhydrase/acetyltransferase-like protein (isoleucine patch superfamily)
MVQPNTSFKNNPVDITPVTDDACNDKCISTSPFTGTIVSINAMDTNYTSIESNISTNLYNGTNNTSIGHGCDVCGNSHNNVVIGTNSVVIDGNNNIIVGHDNKVTGSNNTIFGSNLKITGDNQCIIQSETIKSNISQNELNQYTINTLCEIMRRIYK